MQLPRRKLLLSIALLPVWLVLGELAARVVLAARGKPYDSAEVESYLLDVRSSVVDRIPGMDDRERVMAGQDTALLFPHPFAGWEMLGPQQERELAGFRSGRFDKSYEVLVIGGSVSSLTARFGAKAMQQVLEADPRLEGREVVVLNHGRGSFKQPQMTLKAAYLLGLGMRPDAIVLIDGFNEVALGYDNATLGAHPVFPHWQKYGPMIEQLGLDAERVRVAARAVEARDRIAAETERSLEYGLHHSAILGSLVHRRVRSAKQAWIGFQDALVRPPTGTDRERFERGGAFPEEADAVMDLIARSWVESSVQLAALCDLYGVTFLHVLQPTLHDEGAKVATPEELQSGTAKESWIEGVRSGYPRLRLASSVLRERGVPFLDATDTFAEVEETVYYDACHFRGKGMELFAKRVARSLLEQLPAPGSR